MCVWFYRPQFWGMLVVNLDADLRILEWLVFKNIFMTHCRVSFLQLRKCVIFNGTLLFIQPMLLTWGTDLKDFHILVRIRAKIALIWLILCCCIKLKLCSFVYQHFLSQTLILFHAFDGSPWGEYIKHLCSMEQCNRNTHTHLPGVSLGPEWWVYL